MTPAPTALGSSLRESLARRLYWAIAATLVVGTVATLVLFFVADRTARTVQTAELENYFRARIGRIDQDLRIQGDIFRSQLEFNALFESADSRHARLTAYLTNFGGQQQFTHVIIEDAAGSEVFRFATRTADPLLQPSTTKNGADLSWAYGPSDQAHYRVIANKMWLGPLGTGRLLLFYPLDGAFVNSILVPGSTIQLWRADHPGGLSMPEPRKVEHIQAAISWEPNASASPLLVGTKEYSPPLPLMETAGIVALTMGLLLLLSRIVLGRWLLELGQRLIELGEAAKRYGANHEVAPVIVEKLDRAHANANDEVSQLTHEVRSMILATEMAEAGMRGLNIDLEARVAERTAELQQALNELRRLHDHLIQTETLASLGSMVAGISHELNTPIGNALIVASSLTSTVNEFEISLRDGIKRSQLEAFLQRSREAAELIERSAKKASELIASFKQVAVDQTSEQRRKFGLTSLVDDTMKTLMTQFRNEPWVIEIDVPKEIECDSFPGPLGQILTNLLQNAVVHGFVSRTVGKIVVQASDDEQGRVRLSVKDDGVGMEADVLERIFDPFFTTKLGQGGSGLGLSICYRIATKTLGGRISAQSHPGSGACFTVDFPSTTPGKI